MRRRRDIGSHEAAGMNRWLLTYADMITLLLAFFIVLYAISQVDKYKYDTLVRTLRQVLTGQKPVPTNSSSPLSIPAATQEQQKLILLAKEITAAVKASGASQDVSVTIATAGVRVSFVNGVLFDVGHASIRPEAFTVLNRIALILGSVPNDVIVEGYTDNLPIDTSKYRSNWELAAIRSTTILEYLVGRGLGPTRFAAEAFGQYRPIASNNTAAGRQMNRRVDLLVLRETSPPSGSSPTGGPNRQTQAPN